MTRLLKLAAASVIVMAPAFLAGCGDHPAIAPEGPSFSRSSNGQLRIAVSDPVGDDTGPVDVVSMVMEFDNTTGAYELVLTADAGKPFVGAFRITVSLFNIDVGTTNSNPSYFSVLNDSDLSTPTTTITLTGVHPSLLAWNAGQRVLTTSLGGRGSPDGVSQFRSSVNGFPLGSLANEDVISFANRAQPAIVESTRHRGGTPRTVVVDQAGRHDATTIQQGIDLVRAGGRVRILPGTYSERILIYKGLTLDATRSHDDDDDDGGSGRVVIEQVVTAPVPPFSVSVILLRTREAVVIRGLSIRHVGLRGISNTVEGADLTVERTTFDGPSLLTPPASSSAVGIQNFTSLSGSRARLVIRNSRIETDGTGIVAQGDIDALIERNVFAVTSTCVIVTGLATLNQPTPPATETDVDIVDNEFNRCGSNRPGFNPDGIRVLGLAGIAPTGTVNIIGNTFRNTIRAPDDCNATAIHWESHSGRIERNSFINVVQGCAPTLPTGRGFPAAIFVGSRIAGVLPGSPTVRFNDFVENSFAGLRIGANQPIALEARCNWWGSRSGPSGAGSGTGDAIIVEPDAATPAFAPWAERSVAARGHHHGHNDNACRDHDDDDDDNRDD